jgi:acyl carrier protein
MAQVGADGTINQDGCPSTKTEPNTHYRFTAGTLPGVFGKSANPLAVKVQFRGGHGLVEAANAYTQPGGTSVRAQITRGWTTVSAMEKLIQELQIKIVEILNLPDVSPDDIPPDDQLVGGELGIDSIDVLEMVIMIEKDYGVAIDNKELGAKVFASVRTLAAYIQEKSPELPN